LDTCRKRGERSWPLLLLLARTGRPEAAALYRQLAAQLAPEDDIAYAVLEAMDICGHLTRQDVAVLRGFLYSPKTCGPAVRALLRIDRETTMTEFVQAAADGIGHERWPIAAWFCETPAGRECLLDQLVAEVVASHHPFTAYVT